MIYKTDRQGCAFIWTVNLRRYRQNFIKAPVCAQKTFISLHRVYKKRGNLMTKEKIEEFKKNNCSKCTKNINCKITQNINGELTCTEE